MSMKIQIKTTPALIGQDSQKSSLSIRQRKAEQSISAPLPRVNIESTLPKIKIDQSQCFSESGLKSCAELTADNASYGVQKMYESIARIADQGTQLSNIHESDDKIVSQAYYNAYDQFSTDYNMVTMPRSRPQITLVEGATKVNVTGGTVRHDAKANAPEITYNAGKLDLYLRQKNSIQISVKNVTSTLDLFA